MPFQSSLTPSGCEARCPICGVTLSRQADMKRHLKTKHSNGTEPMHHCPEPNCQYATRLEANLKTHINARHSNGPQHSCDDCGQLFTDAAAKIRHRKKAHGYRPHHTKEYLARKALKGKGSSVQGPGTEVPNTGPATSEGPDSFPNAPLLGAGPRDILRLAHRSDFWRILIDFARRSASEREGSISQGDQLQHSLPFGAVPGHGAPAGTQSFPEGSIHPMSQTQSLISSSDSAGHGSSFPAPVPDVMPLQGQAFTWPFTVFPDQFSNPPMHPYSDGSQLIPASYQPASPLWQVPGSTVIPPQGVATSLPDQFSNPPMHTYSDGPQFIPAPCQPASPLWQVPGSTVTPPQTVSTPLPQPDLFIPGQDLDFDSWFPLNV